MRFIYLLSLICLGLPLKAYHFNETDYFYSIKKTDETIIIDGELNETVWRQAPILTNFWQHYPVDTLPAASQTELRLTYDDQFIYISARCIDENPTPIVQNLIRDDNGSFWGSDGFSVVIDPTNSNQTGYYFGLNAGGAKQDGIITQQGLQPSLDMYWNNTWKGVVKIKNDGFYYEFAIPFNALKYDNDITTWGINFIRNDMRRNAFDIWTRFSSSYNGLDFNYNGNMVFNEGLPKSTGKKIELKPAISAGTVKDLASDLSVAHSVNAGLDSKIAVTENINFDIALLPNFSTVEVDKQFIDFYRYEFKVAEQREFFLENNDLFAAPGSDEDWTIIPSDAYRVKPFYTRRIGIKDWQHTPIEYGGRLSGNVTENLRFGALNMQTKAYNGQSTQNYTAVGIKHKLFQESSLSGLFLNRNSIGKQPERINTDHLSQYNRNAGAEFNFVNRQKSFSFSQIFHHNINPESSKKANFYGSEYEFRNKKIRNKTVFYKIDKNYIADMGYVPRLFHHDAKNDTVYRIGYIEASNYTILNLYPGGFINIVTLDSKLNTYFHHLNDLNELKYHAGIFIETKRRASVYLSAYYSNFEMLFPNDVLKNNNPLPAGEYEDLSAALCIKTSHQRPLMLNSSIRYGKFYNGKQIVAESSLLLRTQPWGVFTISHNMFRFNLPDFDQKSTYHLIGLRSDIHFTRDIYWTSLVQYNTQIDNINVNSLLKWRFRPLSDIMLVVKDDTDLFLHHKKFQIVAKLSYWFRV